MREDLESLDARRLNELGNAYSDYGMYDEAAECYQRSLKLRQESGDRRGEVIVLNNLGALYHRLEKWPEATAYYLKSLEIARELEDVQSQMAVAMNLAFIYFTTGQLKDFHRWAGEAEALARDLGAWEPLAQINSLRGRLSVGEGALPEAMARYGEALRCAAREGEDTFRKILGRVNQEMDRLVAANSHGLALVFCDYLLAATEGLEMAQEQLQALRSRVVSGPRLVASGDERRTAPATEDA